MTRSRRRLAEDVLAGLKNPSEVDSFRAARVLLLQHLIHKREIPNGCDFLFSGPAREIHDALKTLVDVEHRHGPFLCLDYARVDEYFLLRITGSGQYEEMIRGYFVNGDFTVRGE